ncbi:hypothetical protein HYG81_26285 (plasmid) [Natrinema zhouii]|uniref:hypothetical protein n=1 Tax=Natrinema zhouii TaxID=1710539 RepID=UPI001CFFEF53|nr:hypothetical protein [Natrinema zhouii]UHQ99149.1 hypothetical protein HYG81_26285 [Natrinema zhouii]
MYFQLFSSLSGGMAGGINSNLTSRIPEGILDKWYVCGEIDREKYAKQKRQKQGKPRNEGDIGPPSRAFLGTVTVTTENGLEPAKQ